MIKSRRMRLKEHVAGMVEKRNGYNILMGKPKWEETTKKV
jgi:hypothetical protein